jgi:phage tail-like protein
MADESKDNVIAPFTAFNFKIAIQLEGRDKPLCNAAFSECDGLEMTLTPKSLREGGNNNQQIHRVGPVSYGQLTLRRGMTESFDLWEWFDQVQRRERRALGASCEVWMLDYAPDQVKVKFKLTGCLPVKIKAPTLNAKDGQIAVEEMQIAYETLTLVRPQA